MDADGTPGPIALGNGVPGRGSAPRPGRWLHAPGLELGPTLSGRLRPAVVGGLVGVVVALGCAAALVALRGATDGHAPTAHRGLASLPTAAQGPISAALGRDASVYRVVDLRAVNPAQRLLVGFSRGGVTVASGGARLGVTLSAYGYASMVRGLGSVTPRVSANRVSYHHHALQEWFVNGPLGLEQGFDVEARPGAGRGPLTFSLALSGNLASRLQDGSLLLGGGGVALRYGGLVATDARGRVLHSWLQLAGGHLLIRVDDRGAAYPVRIDPFLQQAELTASDGGEGDRLSYSVAISGTTIVAGAPFAKVGSNAHQGAAYVFTMPASGWASAKQTTKLTASDGAANDELGSSVAVSGATVVAGAPGAMVVHAAQGAAYAFTRTNRRLGGRLTATAPGGQADRLRRRRKRRAGLLGCGRGLDGRRGRAWRHGRARRPGRGVRVHRARRWLGEP